jgi:hypothetical protein
MEKTGSHQTISEFGEFWRIDDPVLIRFSDQQKKFIDLNLTKYSGWIGEITFDLEINSPNPIWIWEKISNFKEFNNVKRNSPTTNGSF